MFYIQKDGECVSQVEKVFATTWEDAKKAAWDSLNEGDILAECDREAIEEEKDGRYHRISEDKCRNYASLKRGVWVDTNILAFT